MLNTDAHSWEEIQVYKKIVTELPAVGKFLSLGNVKGITDAVSASLLGLISGRIVV